MAEQVKRTTICELRRAGISCPEIIRSTGYPKSTVYRIVAKFDSEGTAHGAKQVQNFLKENFPLFVPKAVWPSCSPDLNVCDYYLFSVIERESNATPHPNLGSLKAAIKRAFRKLDPDDVRKSCAGFRSRISQIIEAKGGHIE